ncbi:putative nuclease HARBI1 [Huso huso]|uniref:Putative nuclease HARBI1 n=1 Tax=Huso huso TaxID=61971 RepID=A0ABR0YKF3_HUSHU
MADLELAMALVDEEDQKRHRRMKRRRPQPYTFRRHHDYSDLPDRLLIQRFRFDRPSLNFLCELLRDDLMSPLARNHPLPVETKLCAALAFYATGSFQNALGDSVAGACQATMSRAITQVCDALVGKAHLFIRFPRREGEAEPVKQQLRGLCGGLPDALGALGCTHVAIKAPKDSERAYLNRRGFHSINVQLTCTRAHKITSVAANFPGACRDADILQRSAVGRHGAQGKIGAGYLIGDSEYPPRAWLLTPVSGPRSEAQSRYNEALGRVRREVSERTFQLLKRRFRCLDRGDGGPLQYSPERCARIIIACCVLHNVALGWAVPLEHPQEEGEPGGAQRGGQQQQQVEEEENGEEEESTEEEEEEEEEKVPGGGLKEGRARRQELIDLYFS